MYGHEGAARALTDRFTARLPAWLSTIRDERGLTANQLADPHQIRPYFQPDYTFDRYPAISITELDTPSGLAGSRGLTQDKEFTTYTYRYPFRVWVYVRGTTYGDVELQLKRYLTAMRQTILEDLILTDEDNTVARFEPDTVSENFFPPDEDARVVLGAGFVGVVLQAEEVLTTPIDRPKDKTVGPFTITTSLGVKDRDTNQGVAHTPGPTIHSPGTGFLDDNPFL